MQFGNAQMGELNRASRVQGLVIPCFHALSGVPPSQHLSVPINLDTLV